MEAESRIHWWPRASGRASWKRREGLKEPWGVVMLVPGAAGLQVKEQHGQKRGHGLQPQILEEGSQGWQETRAWPLCLVGQELGLAVIGVEPPRGLNWSQSWSDLHFRKLSPGLGVGG